MDAQGKEVFENWERSLALQKEGHLIEACDTLTKMANACECEAQGNQTKFYLDWESRALRDAAGLLLFALSQPEKALTLYLQARDVSRRTGDTVVESACLNNAGDCLRELGRDADALKCYSCAFSLLEHLPYGKGHAISLWNSADTCRRLGRTHEAARQANLGLEIVRRAGDSGRIADFEQVLRQLDLGDTVSRDIEIEDEVLPPNAVRVLSLERRFADCHGTAATVLCGRARWASHITQSGLTKRDVQRVRTVPVSSFPMGCINACVCLLSPEHYYINISPELLTAFWETCRLTGKNLGGALDSCRFIETFSAFAMRLAEGTHVFDGAEEMEEHFFGMMAWQMGTAWVVSHEYGHFLLGHLTRAPVNEFHMLGYPEETVQICQTDSLSMEKEADLFATKVCLDAFASLDDDQGYWLAFSIGALMTILGATSAISLGIRGDRSHDDSSRSHPSVFERVDAVVEVVSQKFPDSRPSIEQAVAPWRTLCCSADSLQTWWEVGRTLEKRHSATSNRGFVGVI